MTVNLTGSIPRFTEAEEQVICANCGRKSARYYETLHLPEGEPYKGNSRVVSKNPWGVPSQFSKTIVWRLNRGTYRPFDYGNFCTLRCAEEFANAAVATGYRRMETT
jgi:hypothetical protein